MPRADQQGTTHEDARAQPSAVVLLSGGLDSATTAAIAKAEGFRIHALSVDYGQRHRFELEAARRVAAGRGGGAGGGGGGGGGRGGAGGRGVGGGGGAWGGRRLRGGRAGAARPQPQ